MEGASKDFRIVELLNWSTALVSVNTWFHLYFG